MVKILNGSELAGYIKERQARQVRGLRQAFHIQPRLAIVKSKGASSVIDAYVRLKKRYGEDILVETQIETVDDDEMPSVLANLNTDPSVHGIIVQLPLDHPEKTDEILELVAPKKDVDGLGSQATFDSATALAIQWLLAAYGVELKGKKLALVGNGRLVGAPLAAMWRRSGLNVTVLTRSSENIASVLHDSDVIVTATGVPHLITSKMIGVGTVVIDAGTASEDGVIVGDLDESVRLRDDLILTPEKGGVGPLTVCALFENVIAAARNSASKA